MNARLQTLISPLCFLVLFCVLPSLTFRPLWFSVLALILIAYRIWLDSTRRPMPPKPIQLIVQGAVGLAVWQHYHSVFGDEASGTWLTLLTCLKLFELRVKRDYFITALLCFLVLMSVMLLDQSLLLSLFMLACALMILVFLYALEEGAWSWKSWRRAFFRPAGTLLKTLPLMVLIFLLFPRFSTGFGSMTKNTAKTGMNDSLRPGSVAAIVPSDELIFRATFLEGRPLRQSLYWRGAVLDQVSGLDWDRTESEQNLRAPFPMSGQDEIEIYLEPGSGRYLFSLDNTRTVSISNEVYRNRIVMREGGIFELPLASQVRERYFLQPSDSEYEQTNDLNRYLQVDEPPSKQMADYLAQYKGLNNYQVVSKLMEHFLNGGYVYSLQPPATRGIDDFFFKTREGFCEHFAGTTAKILRYLNIPSRVVVGFQGGSPSFLENYISVRGHDAHAWLEYYQAEARRWRRLDPTMQVAPQRLTLGSQEFQSEEWMPTWMPQEWAKVYMKARAFGDEIEAAWISALLRFDLSRQRELLARLGMEEVLFRALPVFLILAIILVLAVLYFIEAQGREPLTREERLYRQFQRVLKRWKIAKNPQQGPLTLLQQIEKQDPQFAEQAAPILSALVKARYGRESLSPQEARQLRKRILAL